MKIGVCPLKEGTFQEFLLSFGFSKNSLKNYYSHKRLQENSKKEEWIVIDLLNQGMINPEYSKSEIKILGEDENFLWLHKPEGVHCFPLTYSEQDNVLSFLRMKGYCAPLRVDQTKHEKGLLYRLDQGTSGILLLRKHEQTPSLDSAKKKYLAIVTGELKQNLNLRHFLKPFGPHQKQMKTVESPVDAFEANIFVQPIEFKQGKTLVEVELKEGRRHQIRVQLSAAGFPILGDEMYGGEKAERIFLHAYQYELSGKKYESREWGLFSHFFDLNRCF